MIQVGLAYISQEWKTATYICAAVSCLSLPILIYLPESPIWLDQKQKYKNASKARKRLRKIGKFYSNEHSTVVANRKFTPTRILKDPKLRNSFFMIIFM